MGSGFVLDFVFFQIGGSQVFYSECKFYPKDAKSYQRDTLVWVEVLFMKFAYLKD